MGDSAQAGPSSLAPGPTPYHETSQYRNWRYSPTQLAAIRAELNAKSVEVFTRNSELEKVVSSLFFDISSTKANMLGSAERDGPRLSTSPSNDLPLGGKRITPTSFLYYSDICYLSERIRITRSSGINSYWLHEAFLPQEQCNGVASKDNDVSPSSSPKL